MDERVVVALIVAGTSLVVTVLGQIFNPISQKRLERQKADFQKEIEETKAELLDRTSAEAARRDYEYEARKRLYEEVEPLFFRLYESLEGCYTRILSLSRTARDGRLGTGGDSWISDDGYYLRSTAYKTTLPSVIFRLIQQRMTFIDLKLDKTLRLRYLLLKNMFHAFTDPFGFAALEPKLAYEPDWEDQKLQKKNPAVHRPQGFVVGDFENLTADLLISENGVLRPISFGEFERQLDSQLKDGLVNELITLYRGFSPEAHPVLARMLLGQAGFCALLMATYRHIVGIEGLKQELDLFLNSSDKQNLFRWNSSNEPALLVVRDYLTGSLQRIEEAP